MWIEEIRERAAALKRRIVLPEGIDDRMKKAAEIVDKQSIAEIAVLDKDDLDDFETETLPGDLLRKALNMLNSGEFDGVVAGAINTTADVIRNSLKIIGTTDEYTNVSSFFLMESKLKEIGNSGGIIFADCAVIPVPDAIKLADIAKQTALSAKKILDWDPKVAFLSFSTKGSSLSKVLEPIKDAIRILDKNSTDFTYDGELQLDTAIIPSIAESKDPSGRLRGNANILIFPDLNSGNIAYKVAQRIGGMRAIGPILQGFSKPVNDLSRGCSVDDIVDVVAVTSLQSADVKF